MTTPSGPIVRFTDVTKRYPGASSPALDVKSFTIEKGEFFSILGPSGSGKTTALRLIAGFERADTGRIHIGNEDVTEHPPHRRDVNTVFQSYALFPHMTVRQNVEYPIKMAAGVARPTSASAPPTRSILSRWRALLNVIPIR